MDVTVPGRVVTLADVAALVALPEVQNYICNRTALFEELATAGKWKEKLKEDNFGNLLKGEAVDVPAAVVPAPAQVEAA